MKATAENRFFMGTAIWYLLTVFWGFAPSFYLSGYFDNPEPLSPHLVLHGIIFSIWVLLYVVQVFLVRYRNYKLHQALGILGLVVMILMVPAGIFPSIYKFHVGATTITGAGHNVFRLFTAYILFGLAFKYRKNAFLHKRLMLGCMVMLMSAATFRILMDLDLADNQFLYKGIQILPALLLFLFDLVRLKKVILVDLISIAAVLGIYFFASKFWLSSAGESFMQFLINLFVNPFM